METGAGRGRRRLQPGRAPAIMLAAGRGKGCGKLPALGGLFRGWDLVLEGLWGGDTAHEAAEH